MKGGNIIVLPHNLKCMCLKPGVQNLHSKEDELAAYRMAPKFTNR